MIRNLVLAAAVLALVTVAIPKASADSFDLNVDYCTTLCIPPGTSAGTVTVTNNNTTNVTISVTLTQGTFHQTTGLDAFMFNAISTSAVSISGLTSGYTSFFSTTATHEDGAGDFMGIICFGSVCPQTSGGPATDSTTLTFHLTSTANINVETTNGGKSNVDFAANITTGASCTGLVGGGVGTAQSTPSPAAGTANTSCAGTQVPEPTSVLLLGTGLLFAGKLLKAKLLVG